MKIYSYLAILVFACISLIPPVDFVIRNPQNEYWLWMVLIAGFFGVFTLFIKTQWPVKLIANGALINCFFSSIPYVSFTSYVSVVACCYFYIVCSRVEDWTLILKALKAIVILQCLIMFMQYIGKDPLLNFGLLHVEHFGTVGQHMQAGSMAVILSALLITFNKYFIIIPLLTAVFCHSTWTLLSAGIGIVVYSYSKHAYLSGLIMLLLCTIFIGWASHQNKFSENMDSKSGRMGVWSKSFELTHKYHKDWTGWGIGTYKDLFNPLSGLGTHYRTAHNVFVQLVWEVGYIFTGCLLFALGGLVVALFKADLWLCLSGLAMILMDSQAHFPDRMIQCVPLIILFLAYCQFNLRRFSTCQAH